MKQVIDIYLPPLPPTLAPTDYIRRWDHATANALVAFAITALVSALLWSRPLDMSVMHVLWGVLTWSDYFQSKAEGHAIHLIAVATTWMAAASCAALTFKRALRPYNHVRHISGLRFISDIEEASLAATAQSKAICADQDGWINLHPRMPMPKTWATRGTFIVGGIGSGKTVILTELLEQHFQRKRRMLIYDVKGDFTQMFIHRPNCRLLCPWDERSVLWDIGRDINTQARAKAFANGFFPPAGNDGKIWNDGAALIFTAILIEIMREHGQDWGWDTINRWISMSHAELVEKLERDHPLAVKAMAKEGSNTAASMEMTLGIGVQFIADLAQAWNRSARVERFSWQEWLTKPRTEQRQIIVKAGPDRKATTALMGGIFNYLSNAVCDSSLLPDDELGRSLVFCIDELATIGRFPIDDMIAVGRSKGCVITLGTQDIAQLDAIYGKETRKAIESSLATKIYCQISMGDTRKEVSEAFGYRQIANTLPQHSFSATGNSQTLSIKSEPRAVIDASDFTELLGPRRGKHYKDGFAIRAILSCGRDPLLLEWEGTRWPKPNPASVPASWTRAPLKHRTYRQLYSVMGSDFVKLQEGLRQTIELFEKHNAARRQARPSALDQWKASIGGSNA